MKNSKLILFVFILISLSGCSDVKMRYVPERSPFIYDRRVPCDQPHHVTGEYYKDPRGCYAPPKDKEELPWLDNPPS